MSARIFQSGKRVEYRPLPGIPPFVCIEDEAHTQLCCMAIRARRRREAMGVVIS